jgi:hypothetical protein
MGQGLGTCICRQRKGAMLAAAISSTAHGAQDTVGSRVQMGLWHILLEKRVPKTWEKLQQGPLQRSYKFWFSLKIICPLPDLLDISPIPCSSNYQDSLRTQTPSQGSNKPSSSPQLLWAPFPNNPMSGLGI